MSYVDGCIFAVPTANKQAFLDHAKIAGEAFKDAGALEIVECWGDDIPDGEVTSLPMAVKLKPDETVALSWIIWPDRKTRDEGMKKVMDDHRMNGEKNPMPFDGKRMIFGGFELLTKA